MTKNVFGASPQQRRVLEHSPTTRTNLVCECDWHMPSPISAQDIRERLVSWLSDYEIFRTLVSVDADGNAIQTIVAEQKPYIVHIDRQSLSNDDACSIEHHKQAVRRKVAEEGDRRFSCLIYDMESGHCGVYCVVPSELVDLETLLLLGHSICQEPVSGDGSNVSGQLQYAELAEWQNRLNGEEFGADGLAYWRETSCPSIAEQPLIGGRIVHTPPSFCPVMTQEFELGDGNFCESQLLSIWQLCVAKCAENDHVPIGVTASSRCMEELEDSVGNLGRTLPLRISVNWGDTFSNLLSNVTSVVSRSQEVQEGFSWWQLKHYGDAGFSGYCFYAFAYHDLDRWSTGATRPIWQKTTSDTEPHLLKCLVTRSGGKYLLRLSYVPEVFDVEGVNRMAQRFVQVLEQVQAEPNVTLKHLNFVLPEEIQTQYQHWNQVTQRKTPGFPFCHRFGGQAADNPDNIAISVGSVHTSYAELDAKSNRFARLLADGHVSPGEWVGLSLDRSEKLVIAVLGVMKCGAAYVPIDPGYPEGRVHRIASDANVRLLITNPSSSDRFSGVCLSIDELIEASAHYSSEPIAVSIDDSQPAYSIYTSGSTGKPKGVVVSHGSLSNYLDWVEDQYDIASGQGTVVHSSFSFDLTMTSLLGPLCVGQRATMIPDQEGVNGLIDYLSTHKDCSLLKITPSHLDLLTSALTPLQMKNSVRSIVIGGEALFWKTIEPWLDHSPNVVIFNEYGPTEATVGCCVERITSDSTHRCVRVPIGTPIYNTTLYVFDEHQNFLPIGSAGELYIGGMGLATKYNNEPELTASSFIYKTFDDGTTQRLYRTGDRVRYLSDGRLDYLGRNDGQIKLRGFRIELGEIENALREQSVVEDVVVSLVEIGSDSTSNKVLVGYVVTADDRVNDTFEDLKSVLQLNLPDYMIPSHWVGLKSLPLTSNGKVDTARLPLPQLKTPYVEPTTALERIFADTWERELGVEKVGINDNYFELGGDSIRSIAIISAVKEHGMVFTLNDLFAHPTISELVAVVREGEPDNDASRSQPFDLVSPDVRSKLPSNIVDAYPMTVLQQGMIYYNQIHGAEKLYHDIFSYRLQVTVTPSLSEELVKEAFSYSLEKHDALRTTFSLSEYGEPLQLVHAKGAEDSLKYEDLRHLSSDEQHLEIERVIRDEKRLGFEINELPLARIFIHVLSDDQLQFSLSFHHAIIDGWSDAILLKELFESTIALLNGGEVSQTHLAVRFRDYVELELNALQSDEFRGFWRNTLSGMRHTPLPSLNTKPRSDLKESIYNVSLGVSDRVGKTLDSIAKALGVPLKSVVLTAHLRALNVIAIQEDVTSSVVSSGRPVSKDGDKALGLFINSLPLRIDFSALRGKSWSQLIEAVFSIETECLKYRRFPYGRMKEFSELDSVSDFLFYYTDYHNLEGLFDSTGVKLLETTPYERSSFPCVVHFNIDPETKQLSGEIECSSQYLTYEHVTEYASLYRLLLEDLACSLDEPFDSLSRVASSNAEVPPFYSDVALRNDQYLLEQLSDDSVQYWNKRLSGSPVSPTLVSVDVKSSTVSRLECKEPETLAPELTDALRQVASAQGVSIETVLSSTYAILMSRYSGQKDVLVRHALEKYRSADAAITHSTSRSSIVVRTTLTKDMLFSECAQQSECNRRADERHQDVSYETLLRYRQNNEAFDNVPLCGVCFSFSDRVDSKESVDPLFYLPGQEEQAAETIEIELSVVADAEDSRLTVQWNYDANRYRDELIDQLSSSYHVLLENIVKSPERNVFAYSICSEEESANLLAMANSEWQDSEEPNAILNCLEQYAQQRPDSIAVLFDTEIMTYGELDSSANLLANYLVNQMGVEPQQKVGVCLDPSVDYIVALVAVLKAGAAYVPIDPDLPIDRIDYMCSDARLDIAVTKYRYAQKLSRLAIRTVATDEELYTQFVLGSAGDAGSDGRLQHVDDRPAYVVYTSGTTGQPKGVVVNYRAFSGHIATMADYYEYTEDDRALLFSTVGVDATQELIFCALTRGAAVCMHSEGKALGKAFDQRCEQQGVTVLDVSPAFASVLFAHGNAELSYVRDHVRLLILGGDALTSRVFRCVNRAELTCRVVNAYGPTEAVVTSVAFDYAAGADLNYEGSSVPIGKPMGGRQVYVLNEQMALVPRGVVGELYIGGAYLSQGYLNKPDLTDKQFIVNPFTASPTDRLYKTGDQVRWTTQKTLQFVARTDNQVSVNGFRVELGELESLLSECQLVSEAVVLVDQQVDGSNRLLAYVVLNSQSARHEQWDKESPLVAERLREFLSAKVPDYMVPRFYRVVESVPLNASGKVDHDALRRLDVSDIDEYLPPTTGTERALCTLWQSILEIPRVGISNNFFHVGGDSLKALQLLSQLKDRGVNVELKDIFSAPTVVQLARLVESAAEGSSDSQSRLLDIDAARSQPVAKIRKRGARTTVEEQLDGHAVETFAIEIDVGGSG